MKFSVLNLVFAVKVLTL